MTNNLTKIVFDKTAELMAKERGISIDAAGQYASLSVCSMTDEDKIKFIEYHKLDVPNLNKLTINKDTSRTTQC